MAKHGRAAPAAPDDASGLTAEWLTTALRHGGLIEAASVTAAVVEPIGTDQAFAGQPWRVRLSYDRPTDKGGADAGAPATLVAKLPAVDPAMRRALSGLRWYEAEIRFYDEVAPLADILTPRRYYTAMQPDERNYVLLLEDVTAGTVGDQIAGATLAQAQTIVDHIARLHAQWWDSPMLDAFDWLARGAVRRAEAAEFWAGFYQQGWPVARDLMSARPDPPLPDGIDTIAERLASAYAALVRESAESPRTLLHGDCRLDNVFFPDAGPSPAAAAPVTFIDWQLVSAGRGAYDLAYFLGTNLTPDVRRAHEEALLERYHAVIVERDPGYGLDRLRSDYGLGLLLVFGFWVQTAGAATYPEAGYPLRDAALGRVSRALLDRDAGALLHRLDT
ncbi:MAG: phosphotransferase [Dehalococcoidia bacterium]|nr:phosphotransferase [Dehalococcoidia bacterium]